MKTSFLLSVTNMKVWFAAILIQITPVGEFISKYMFNDFGFLKSLVIVMTLDLITGIAKVWKNEGAKAITSKGLRDTIIKFIQYGAFLIVAHVFTHYQIGGEPHRDLEWVNKLAKEFILIIEVKSVYENIVRINSRFDFVSKLWDKVSEFIPRRKPEN